MCQVQSLSSWIAPEAKAEYGQRLERVLGLQGTGVGCCGGHFPCGPLGQAMLKRKATKSFLSLPSKEFCSGSVIPCVHVCVCLCHR